MNKINRITITLIMSSLIFCENAQAIDGALLGYNHAKSGNNQDNISFVYVRNQTPLSFNISSQSNYQMSEAEELKPQAIPAFYTSPLGNAVIASKPESYQIFQMRGMDFESNSYLMGFRYLGSNLASWTQWTTLGTKMNKNDDRATVNYLATDTNGHKIGFKLVAKVRDSKGTANFDSVALQMGGTLLGGADGMALAAAGYTIATKEITQITSQLELLASTEMDSRLLLKLTRDQVRISSENITKLKLALDDIRMQRAQVKPFKVDMVNKAEKLVAAEKIFTEKLLVENARFSYANEIATKLLENGVTNMLEAGAPVPVRLTSDAVWYGIEDLEKSIAIKGGQLVEGSIGEVLPYRQLEAALTEQRALASSVRTGSRFLAAFTAAADVALIGLLIYEGTSSGDEFGRSSSQISELKLEPSDDNYVSFENIVDEVDIQEVRMDKKVRISFISLERPYMSRHHENLFVYRDHDAATMLSIIPEEQALPTGAYKNRCIVMGWDSYSRVLRARCYQDGLTQPQIESAISYDLMRPESDTSSNGIAQGVDNKFNVKQCILGTDINVDASGHLICAEDNGNYYARWEPKLIRNADWMSDFGSEIYTFDKTTFRLSGKDATTGKAAIITSIDYAKECQENTNLSLIKNNGNKTVGSYSLQCVSPKQQGMTNLFTGAIQSAKEAVKKVFS